MPSSRLYSRRHGSNPPAVLVRGHGTTRPIPSSVSHVRQNRLIDGALRLTLCTEEGHDGEDGREEEV
jgi:hypothetical protein